MDAKTLHVFIDKDAYDVVMAAHRNAATISVSTRVIATNFSSTEGLSLRASETGRLFVFALNSSSRTLISDVHSVVVTTCDRFLAVGDKSDFADSSEDSAHVKRDTAEIIEFPPQPLFRLAGVAAIAGMHPVVVPHVTAPVMVCDHTAHTFFLNLYFCFAGKWQLVNVFLDIFN